MLHTTSDRRLPSITDAQRGWSGGVDPVVQTFVSSTYANITDPAQIAALNYLVTALKENGFWSRFHVLYPFIGGNSTSHRFNLVNPSLYAITFTGSFVHSSNGISGTASANATATTGFADSNIDVTNVSFAYYGSWNITGQITFGNTASSGGPSFLFGGTSVRIAGGGGGGSGVATPVSGLQFVSTSTGTAAYGLRNQFTTVNFTRGTTTSGSWIIQLSRTADVTLNTMKLAFISQAYTSAEALILEEIIEQYQELLGRQDYNINPNFDVYTNRFINTVGSANLSSAEQSALDYLITNLRATTIFSKIGWLYPMLGTTAATQVRDVINLQSLTLSGSFSHTSLGMDPLTVSSFAGPPNNINWTSNGWTQGFFASYINEQNTTNGIDVYGTTTRLNFLATNGVSTQMNVFGGATSSTANTNTVAFWIGNWTGLSSAFTLYRNGSSYLTGTAGANNSTIGPYLFGLNTGGSGSLRRQALHAFGPTALTALEASDFNTIVQQYQTLLGRA